MTEEPPRDPDVSPEAAEFLARYFADPDDPIRDPILYEGKSCKCGHQWDVHKVRMTLDFKYDENICEGKEQLEESESEFEDDEDEGCQCGRFRPISRDTDIEKIDHDKQYTNWIKLAKTTFDSILVREDFRKLIFIYKNEMQPLTFDLLGGGGHVKGTIHRLPKYGLEKKIEELFS